MKIFHLIYNLTFAFRHFYDSTQMCYHDLWCVLPWLQIATRVSFWALPYYFVGCPFYRTPIREKKIQLTDFYSRTLFVGACLLAACTYDYSARLLLYSQLLFYNSVHRLSLASHWTCSCFWQARWRSMYACELVW